MNAVINSSKLYAQWYNIKSRAMYQEAGQGALWRAQNGTSIPVVGIVILPSLADINWQQNRIESAVLTVNFVAANYNALRVYRSTRNTYDNETYGSAYVDTASGYTDIAFTDSTSGSKSATLTSSNIEFFQAAAQAGVTMFCLYYDGDVATENNPSAHYIRINSFSLSIEYNYAKSKISSISDADIESATTISWTNYLSTGLVTKLRIVFGSFDSGDITVTGTSYQYTIPSSWYAQIPNAPSGTATVTLSSYLNGALIGSDVGYFVASAGSAIVPVVSSISATVINDNATVASWNIALQGYSKIQIDASASAGSGASIVSYTIAGPNEASTEQSSSGTYQFTTAIVETSGSLRYTVTVTDSRGRTGSSYVDVPVTPYAAPVITAMGATRCASDGTPNSETGTYAKAAINYTWSQVGNNTMTNQIRYKRHQDLSYIVADTNVASWIWSSVFGGGTLDVATAYDVQGYIVDALGNNSTYNVILASVAGFHLGLKNDRARFGGVSERAGLEVNWASQFDGPMTLLDSLTLKPSVAYPIYVKDRSDVLGFQMINYNGVCEASFYNAGTERNYLGNGRFSCYDGNGTETARLSSDKSLKLGSTTLTEAQLISLLSLI